MKLLESLLNKVAEKAADRATEQVISRLKAERTSQIGFQLVEPEDLYESQFHRVPKER